MKIAVIGAGSTYTPELINGFIARADSLKIDEFCFMDIDQHKQGIVAAFAQRMLKAAGMNAKVKLTGSLQEAVAGADFVIGQIRVGLLEARIKDEKIPLKYNLLGQETTGIGGMMNALRTIPVIMNIAREIERLAPNAWFINFSNPSGIIAEALLHHSCVKTIGLCNGPINMIKDARTKVPEGTKQFDYDFVGLNHLCWITAIYADGREILRELFKDEIESIALKNIPGRKYTPDLMGATGGIPISYLNYYYFREQQIEKCKLAEKTRGEICVDIENELLELYSDPSLVSKPEILDKRGGALYSEAAVSVIDSIVNDKGDIHVVNVLNNGAYEFMNREDVVEVKCTVGKDGPVPVKLRNFSNEYIIGMMKAVKMYEKLTIKAALNGSFNDALSALMVHPIIGDYDKAQPALKEMLWANRDYLPQFTF